jgi:DNA-binding NtrC family response regulator
VLDDDEDSAGAMEAALSSVGFTVEVARSCPEARANLEASPYDALVTDLSVSDCDGIEFLVSLGERRPRVAILVTGHSGVDLEKRSREAGFQALLVKPFVLSELERLIRTSLASRSIRLTSS